MARRLLLAFWLRTRGPASRPGKALVVLLAALPLFVAASRLYQGAHHPTDVGTSLVYGTIWLATAAVLLLPRDATAGPPVTRSEGGLRDTPVPHG